MTCAFWGSSGERAGGGEGERVMTNRTALLIVLGLLVALVAACSADSACALGGLGWCENGMAALAVRSAAAAGTDTIAIVEEGFTVNFARYGITVVALKPEGVSAYVAGRGAANSIMVVISNVRVTNSPGPGSEAAQGTATITVYQGSSVLRTETVRGRLMGTTWTLANN
jgi:hypothetical protein